MPVSSFAFPGYFILRITLSFFLCPTDFTDLHRYSTCLVFDEGHADIADDADIFLPLGVSADLLSAVKKCSTFSLRICDPL